MSIVKWAGGKTAMKTYLLPLLRSRPDMKYVDLFCGSLALPLLFEPANAHLNDINRFLINLYEVVRDDLGELVVELERLNKPELDCKEAYNELLAEYNGRKFMADFPKARMAALFVYLNKRGFNGLYRENRKGIFNVPYRSSKSFSSIFNIETLVNMRKYFVDKRVTFSNVSYDQLYDVIDDNTLVYVDPPYYPTSASSFTSYWYTPFGVHEQNKLATFVQRLCAKGAKVVVSNRPCPETRSLYGFLPNITEHAAVRSMRSAKLGVPDGTDAQEPNEMIAHNLFTL